MGRSRPAVRLKFFGDKSRSTLSRYADDAAIAATLVVALSARQRCAMDEERTERD